MKENLQELIDTIDQYDPYFGDWTHEQAVEYGWNSARDTILKILRDNLRHGYHEDSGGRNGFDVKEIPWPYAERVIEKIENL